MSYHLKAGEPVEAEVRRLAADQLDRAFCELDDPALDRDETVHQARKRYKKLRGLLRLVRPAIRGKTYPRENRALRDAQRLLSPLRDARARLGSLALLRDAFDEVLDADARLACAKPSPRVSKAPMQRSPSSASARCSRTCGRVRRSGRSRPKASTRSRQGLRRPTVAVAGRCGAPTARAAPKPSTSGASA